MKRRLPLMIVLVLGIFGAVAFVIPHPIVKSIDETMRNDVLRIITAFSLVLGVGSIIQHHLIKIRRKAEHWPFSYIALISLAVSAAIGLFGGIDPASPGILPTHIGGFSFHMQALYDNIMIPLASTMFALLAFFMASAAYRAFRARNLEATLLLIAAFILMLGAVPLGRMLIRPLPDFAEWILTVPNTAAKRGIMFGIGLGSIATSLKIILGIERGWLGGGG
ncbi:hypothetical protein CH330_00425 [candidate division WOR-3 bacterium JGI_Cruoil_03_51_56]|uniref:Uncharacterized protein n=1 Tax=candidate division WOR-3 bacterium JGI_Cruoil_03_51_56 TaxID=1973747 RepID=A0A235C0M0_UNCW3|nr:MAG: hypothetical protein CH330_00425 [candidate division WOR-3 bacterium JGI_Cruoil_03_51_56]